MPRRAARRAYPLPDEHTQCQLRRTFSDGSVLGCHLWLNKELLAKDFACAGS